VFSAGLKLDQIVAIKRRVSGIAGEGGKTVQTCRRIKKRHLPHRGS